MRKSSLILSFFLALVLGNSALAMDWEELKPKYAQAKTEGYIGEQANGYIGVIKQGENIDLIVQMVNDWRKKRYQTIARDNGLSLSAVESQAGQKLFEKADSGSYIQINGKWVKK